MAHITHMAHSTLLYLLLFEIRADNAVRVAFIEGGHIGHYALCNKLSHVHLV